MPKPKPYVQAACICEKVITEQDEVASIIRLVDTFTLPAADPPIPPTLKPAIPLTVFIAVKSGEVTGSHVLGLVLRRPDGTREKTQSWPVVFNGGEHGANVTVQLQLVSTTPGRMLEMGLYWFDVLWGEEVLTSIPIRFKRQEEPTPRAEPKTT